MEIKELRVGNLVADGSKITEVTAGLLSNWEVLNRDFGGYQPIELNEKLLIRFGFEKIYCHHFGDYEYHKFINGSEYLVWFTDYSLVWFTDYSFSIGGSRDEISKGYCYCSDGVIKYANQLQNLYFALTNEELKLKEL